MKSYSYFICFFISLVSFSQNRFEKGYIVNNNNERIECLIKNEGWYNSPTSCLYKLNEDDKINRGDLSQIKAFGIGNEVVFERYKVDIDRSPDNLQNMSTDKAPIFKEETLFLRLLVEGSANLYYYQDSNLRRFFIGTNDRIPVQLVYKKYKVGQKIKTNQSYRNQILDKLKCSDIDLNTVRNLEYYKSELIKIFDTFNKCKTGTSNILRKGSKSKINLWAKLGFVTSNVDFNFNAGGPQTENLGTDTSILIGFELEYVLPFNNNKWSIFFSPTYQSYRTSKRFNVPNSFAVFEEEVDFTYIDFLFAVRHHFFITNKSILFINAGYIIPMDIGDNMISDREITSTGSFSFGLGYNFNNKVNIEARYNSGRDLLDPFDFRTTSANFSSIGFIIGYNFF